MTVEALRLDASRAVRDLESEVVGYRHHLHRNPELSNREAATAAYIADQLRSFGVDEVRTGIAGHGVIGVVRGGRPGTNAIVLRADMDALPVRETSGVEYSSDVKATGPDGISTPVSHACGHDWHMATVLGAARVLSALRAELPGTVYCVFQPAEEGPPPGESGGAQAMLDSDAFADIEPTMAFGMHVSPLPIGTIGYRSGVQFAASTRVEIAIRGRQTHAAMPWLGRDPLLPAAGVIQGAAQLTRRVSALHPAVVTIGHLRDRGRFNIIGDQVTLEGTIRCVDDRDMASLVEAITNLAVGQAHSYGCTAEVRFDQEVPALVNRPEWLEASLPTLRRVVGPDRLLPVSATLGYDDMSAFIRRFGGLYLLCGAQDTRPVVDASGNVDFEPLPGGRGMVPNHHPAFYADDSALRLCTSVHVHIALDHLAGAVRPAAHSPGVALQRPAGGQSEYQTGQGHSDQHADHDGIGAGQADSRDATGRTRTAGEEGPSIGR